MTTALLIVDIQNDYFPGGAMPLEGAEAAGERAGALLQAFRAASLPVIHVQHVSTRPGATFFLPGTPGAEFHASVRPAAGEPTVVKHFPNAFRDTALHDLAGQRGIDHLVIAGMMTHMCVDATCRAAFDLGLRCSVAADACATRELAYAGEAVPARQVHLAFLSALNGLYAKVGPAAEIIRGLG